VTVPLSGSGVGFITRRAPPWRPARILAPRPPQPWEPDGCGFGVAQATSASHSRPGLRPHRQAVA